MPKSSIFFSNVSIPLRNQICAILPFVVGTLPVRYLGVPLVESRILIRDCKVLVDKVKARVLDWKNKYLSYAGRLQLINSVLMSMQVYWCSVFLLPKSTIYDIEKVLRDFLWNGGNFKRGGSKVAWAEVCKPKNEGGLGIRGVKTWNLALLTNQIWRLFNCKESLWVAWVHTHHLKGRSFWHVDSVDLEGSGWTNMLDARDLLKQHIWSMIGNGDSTNAWFDSWHLVGPLASFISRADIEAEFTLKTKVKDLVADYHWQWPPAWMDRYPLLLLQGPPVLQQSQVDKVVWRGEEGEIKSYSVSQVWRDIRETGESIAWHKVVWFKANIPGHAFILWLAIRARLQTQDRMAVWSGQRVLLCPFCKNQPDSHMHLFFDCMFPLQVWSEVKIRAGINIPHNQIGTIIDFLQPRSSVQHIQVDVERLVFAATIYMIWKERNGRIHSSHSRPKEDIINDICDVVRLRLVGLRWRFSDAAEKILLLLMRNCTKLVIRIGVINCEIINFYDPGHVIDAMTSMQLLRIDGYIIYVLAEFGGRYYWRFDFNNNVWVWSSWILKKVGSGHERKFKIWLFLVYLSTSFVMCVIRYNCIGSWGVSQWLFLFHRWGVPSLYL
ncbi:hypothetical protein LXL04_035425 [Taraxacum kok-saghyz]